MPEKLSMVIDIDDKGIPKVSKLTGELDKLKKELGEGERHMSRWERRLKKAKDVVLSMKGALAGLALGYAALKMARMAKGWMDLSGAQEAAEKSLRQVMVSMGRYSDEFYGATLKQASAMQKLTGVGDETILQGQKFLFTFKQISDEAMPRTTAAMMDLAALMGGDVQRAALTLGKASMGLTGELRRVGITVDETTFKQQGFLGVLAEIEAQVKGQAKTFRTTWLGTLQALRSEWGDLKEVVGGWLVEIAKPWAEKQITRIRNITQELKKFKEQGKIDKWAKEGAEAIKSMATVAMSAFSIMNTAVSLLMKAFYGWLLIIQGVKTAWAGLKETVSDMIQKQKEAAREIDPYGFLGAATGMRPEKPWQPPEPEPTTSALQKELDKLYELIRANENLEKTLKKLKNEVKSLMDVFNKSDDASKNVNENIKSTNDHLKNLKDNTKKATREVYDYQKAWIDTWKAMEDHFVYGFASMLRRGIDSFKDFVRAIKDMFLDMLARMTAEAVARPIVAPVFAGLSQGMAGLMPATMAGGLGGWASKPLWGGIGPMESAAMTGFYGPLSPTFGAATAPTWGAMLGAGGLGYLGGSLMGGQTGGIGGGLGAAGGYVLGGMTALGGPVGAVIGGVLGALGGALFGKKKPEMRLEWTIDEQGFRQSMDYWAGGLQRSGELINQIESVIAEQYRTYSLMAQMTEKNINNFKISLTQLGLGDLGKISFGFAISNQEILQRMFPGTEFGFAEIEEQMREIEAYKGPWSGWFKGQKMQELSAGLMNIVEPLIAQFRQFEQSFSEIIGTAFANSLQTREFDMFKQGLKTGIYSSFREAFASVFYEQFGIAVLRGIWGQYDQGFETAIGEMVTTAMAGGKVNIAPVVDMIELMTDTVDALKPAFDSFATAMQTLESALGLNTIATIDNTSSLTKAQQVEEFIAGLSTSNLAPVQSREGYEHRYQQLLEEGDPSKLFPFVQGKYLPFMQTYTGDGEDYKDIYGRTMKDIRGMAEGNMPMSVEALEQQRIRGGGLLSSNQLHEIHVHVEIDGNEVAEAVLNVAESDAYINEKFKRIGNNA